MHTLSFNPYNNPIKCLLLAPCLEIEIFYKLQQTLVNIWENKRKIKTTKIDYIFSCQLLFYNMYFPHVFSCKKQKM